MTNRKSILFRVPADLKVWLEGRAASNHRTLTGELVQLLEAARDADQKQEAA
ncbi:hypothetical protein ABGN05_00125 [Aquibium sp. LZ166]|uniref:Arc family DNA-binding protein n=1 Tax=Aquibium pacificus TaxID=3153579 RepID=A0ABV3SCH8_9HYPH